MSDPEGVNVPSMVASYGHTLDGVSRCPCQRAPWTDAQGALTDERRLLTDAQSAMIDE